MHVSITVSNLEALTRFYCDVLGFSFLGEEAVLADEGKRLMLDCPARRAHLQLGEERLELLCPGALGRPYPPRSSATDAWFQHIAIVVSDMEAAYTRLCAYGVTPITIGGPQMLPPSSGGVAAFKFRDPDGHPLELLAFPSGADDPRWQRGATASPFLGIDHSAIVVQDAARAMAFYEGLGLSVAARTLNQGPKQERLDGAADVRADVIALRPGVVSTPHIELLSYQNPHVVPLRESLATRDIASARLVVRVSKTGKGGVQPSPLEHVGQPKLQHDPDRHAIVFEQSSNNEQHLAGRGLRSISLR